MKNFVEKIKDFLYDATDYVLILVIIVGVAAIIGWRLDILFAKDMDKTGSDNDKAPITDVATDNKDNNNTEKDNTEKDNTDNKSNENINDITDNKVDENTDNNSSNSNADGNVNTDVKTDTEEIITVKIPNGSLPPTIANILLEKGLIENKMEFLIKSQELKLDTKLKSGEYNIKKGTSLEELIRTLAK